MTQEVVKADPKIFPHKMIMLVGMGPALRTVEARVVLKDVQKLEKGLAQVWVWELCRLWHILQQKGNHPLHRGLWLRIPRPRGQRLKVAT